MLKRFKILGIFLAIFAMVFHLGTGFAKTQESKTVKDLTKAYEVWQKQGIKFVVRDSKGKFVTWNIGRLESWSGKSKWVVRNTKGHFITHAHGKVENWKNGQTRLVLRDSKGRMLTHIGINITDRASFAANVVGLRKLKNDKFLSFVQKTISDLLMEDLKKGHLTRVRVLTTYLDKYQKESGVSNFKPILRKVAPQINFMATEKPDDKRIQETAEMVREMIKLL